MRREILKIIIALLTLVNSDGVAQAQASNSDQIHPQQQTDGMQLFRQYCSFCHAPPAPMSRTAKEWPPIVIRMKKHMVTKGAAVPSNEDLHEITEYLQKHAG